MVTQGAISQGERRAASAISNLSTHPFSSSPRAATKAAKEVVKQIMDKVTMYPPHLKLRTQFENTGLALPNDEEFKGDISKIMNRVLGLTFDAQKFVLSKTIEQFRKVFAEMRKKNQIDPETKRYYPIHYD
jgi:hypothetical protein